MDSYETAHFAFDPGGRRVADSTLGLMLTFRPAFTARTVELVSRSIMDQPLREALGYDAPPRAVVRLSRAKTVGDLSWIGSYPDGFVVSELDIFPQRCPVPHDRAATTGP